MSEIENATQPNQEIQPEVVTESPEKELTVDELKAELKRVRQEAASRRISERELKEKAKRWEEYEESQKTELQKLQEKLADRENKLTSYEMKEMKQSLIDEFELDKEDLELLTGADESSNRKIAERLKAKNDKMKEKETTTSLRPADLLAGNRGTPVGSTNNHSSFDDVLRNMAKGRR